MIKSQSVLSNTIFGVVTNILQNILLGISFVLLARGVELSLFSDFVIGNSLYQIVAAFSTMGLAHYFTRKYVQDKENRGGMVYLFIYTEVFLSLLAAIILLVLTILLYFHDGMVTNISLIIGCNLFFDNIIYVIKAVHVAEKSQYKMLLITLVESILKLILILLFYLFKFNFFILLIGLVLLRFVTLFQSYYSLPADLKTNITLKSFFSFKIANLKMSAELIYKGRVFVIIGAVSVLFWRLNALLLSKICNKTDVGFYEIGFKLFAIVQIIPVIYMNTIYPILSEAYSTPEKFRAIASRAFRHMLLFSSLLTIMFYVLSPIIISLLFGDVYLPAIKITQKLFLALIPFSLALVQANVLLASQFEIVDMWINIISLIMNILFGYLFIKMFGLIGSAYGILFAFVIFYFLQAIFLLSKRIYVAKYNLIHLFIILLIVSITVLITEMQNYFYIKSEIICLISLSLLVIYAIKAKILDLRSVIKNAK